MILQDGQHIVAELDEIPPGQRKIVNIDGREIGVFNVNGKLYAIRNRCPHQGGPLCGGTLGGVVTSSAPGEYHFERAGEMLRCPWHQWEYDVTTGQSWFDPEHVRTRAYRVHVEAGAELGSGQQSQAAGEEIDISSDGPPTSGLQPGPYVAETYPVSVEREYVIVDLRR